MERDLLGTKLKSWHQFKGEFMAKYLSLKEIFSLGEELIDQEVLVKGWIRSVRKSKTFSFLVLNDGSTQNNLQIIADSSLGNYDAVASALSGTSVMITGLIKPSGGKGQSIEMHGKSITIVGAVDEEFPLQKKAHSLEFLREVAHLRARTQTFGAIWRIRNALQFATHKFFNERGFINIHTPIITGLDAEGAGEMFKVTTLHLENLPKNDKGQVDYSQDYFGQDTSLSVSGQLQAEAMAIGLGKVYTFGPTFRSENSNTKRHLSEFWMVEPEVAFFELEQVAELAVDYIKYLITYALDNCMDELLFLNYRPMEKGGVLGASINEKENYIEEIKKVAQATFTKISYTDAMEICSKSGKKFEFPTFWGAEMQTEHERYLAEEYFKGPVIVTDYPKDFKAFYMKQNPDGKTVRAMDILVPGVGEIVGGSQREDNLEKLQNAIKEKKMNDKDLWWYLELRKWGSVPHGGFGLGFERALLYITGMTNVRDIIPFPRTPKNATF
jgi:asparaginyl-tRNA synthetase